MQKTLAALFASSTLFAASHALAQTTYFRDQRGVVTGRAEQRGSTTWFRDERGVVTGRAERKGDGVEFRDPQGRYLGRAGSR